MGKHLPVPPELEHLIEKRERQTDRRQSEQRKDNLGPLGAIESADQIDEVPTIDRRRGTDRRKKKRRNKRNNG
jgi:hypothetical protein